MKWMIASDLHGSAYYCRKMLEAFEREGATGCSCWATCSTTAPATTCPESTPQGGHPPAEREKEKLLCVPGQL